MHEQEIFDALRYRIVNDGLGNRFYYNNADQLHRENGPAIEYARGTKVWYQNGHCHRTDGPAIMWPDGRKWWYLNDMLLSEDEFKEAVKHNV